jgi:hypothetical protein
MFCLQSVKYGKKWRGISFIIKEIVKYDTILLLTRRWRLIMTILWENVVISFVALAVFAVVAVLVVKILFFNRKTRR